MTYLFSDKFMDKSKSTVLTLFVPKGEGVEPKM